MWNEPKKLVEALNKKYIDEGWKLKCIRKLSDGNSGAMLILCQAETPHRNFVVVKSFSNVVAAKKEFHNNKMAYRQFHISGEFLTDVDEFKDGACFTMRLAGEKDGRPLSDVVKEALKSNDCKTAVQAIKLVSSKFRRLVLTADTEYAFTDAKLDDNLHKQLKGLNPDLYDDFKNWWEKKTSHKEYSHIAIAPAHGDLHTDNVFVANVPNLRENDVYLIDFGCYGNYPILKDFARLERDIRFRLFKESLTDEEDVEEKYLSLQSDISKLILNSEDTPEDTPKELQTVVKLVRVILEQARKSIGGSTSFEYAYIRFLEFLFFAASPIEGRASIPQRKAAFQEAMELTKRIDVYYKEDVAIKDRAVLWRLAYSFLRLEQLPSGGWARSLPNWIRMWEGDTEESRCKGHNLRKTGGINLTCVALLNYTRTLCELLDKNPDQLLIKARDKQNESNLTQESDETKKLLDDLNEIEERNKVCENVVQYIIGRVNNEGAIPASKVVREVDTEVHHTLLGITSLLLAYFLTGKLNKAAYQCIKDMCFYLENHGKNVRSTTGRQFEIYCVMVFLNHLLSYEFFKTTVPSVQKSLNDIPERINEIREKIFGRKKEINAYPEVDNNASEFLMNLPLLLNLSGHKTIEKDPNFTSAPLGVINFASNNLVKCPICSGNKEISDWGQTAEYWWAKIRLSSPGVGKDQQHQASQTLIDYLTDYDALSLTHGVSFSYAMGLGEQPSLDEFQKLDSEIDKMLYQEKTTEKSVLYLIMFIYHQVYGDDIPQPNESLEDNRTFLASFPRGHKFFPIISEIKNLLIRKLEPGCYNFTKDNNRNTWIETAIENTKEFFKDDLSEQNTKANWARLSYKKWFHLFEYVSNRPAANERSWVFDIGCGSGAHAIIQFLPRGYRVHFFDCSKLILEQLRSNLEKASKEEDNASAYYDIMEGNIEDIPGQYKFDPHAFHAPYKIIFADAILFHIGKNQVPEILGCLHHMLSNDGFFFVNFKINDHTQIAIDGRLFEYYSSHWEVQKMIEDAGFRIEDVTITQKESSMYGNLYPTHWAHFICSKGISN